MTPTARRGEGIWNEVATHLGVRRESVYRWIKAKGLPAHKVGRLFRFKLSEIDEWVRAGSGDDSSAREDAGEPGRQ